jgi:hypothetical protein
LLYFKRRGWLRRSPGIDDAPADAKPGPPPAESRD